MAHKNTHSVYARLGSGGEQITIDASLCLGCGICVRNCAVGAIYLETRNERVITPVDTEHRTVLMAIKRGTLHHLIFDNQVMFSHRALAAVLGAILKLPAAMRALANRQLKSRWLEAMLTHLDI